MIALAYYLLKVMVCSGILFLYYHVALRNKLFHHWNRFYLLGVVILSLAAPLLEFQFMHHDATSDRAIRLLQAVHSADHYMEEIYIRGRQPLSKVQWLGLGYGLISVLILAGMVRSFLKIAAIIGRHPVCRINQIKFISSREKGTPFSFFRYIFWNEKIDIHSTTGQQIFQHELVHVKEAHTLDKLFLQLVLTLFWSNPFFWLIRRELQLVHEFIADKKAVQEHDTASFAAMILQSAYPSQFSSLTNSFFHSPIKRRLLMLTKIQKPRINYASRILVLPLMAFVVLAFSFRAKSQNPVSTEQTASGKKIQQSDPTILESDKVVFMPAKTSKIDTTIQLLIINGKEYDRSLLSKKTISAKRVIVYEKDNPTAIKKYGNKARKGVMVFENAQLMDRPETKDTIPSISKQIITIKGKDEPIYYLDGKEFSGDLNKLNPDIIESIRVLKDQPAIAKYGHRAKNGVIEIFTKSGNYISDTVPRTEPIFEKAEVEASVDKNEWRRFLEKNLQSVIETAASKGMPPGQYTVNLRFLVRKDGTLTNFKALNDPGYGLVQKLLEIIPNSPKWKPAEQNGKPVLSYHTQPLTFVISDGGDSKGNNAANTDPVKGSN